MSDDVHELKQDGELEEGEEEEIELSSDEFSFTGSSNTGSDASIGTSSYTVDVILETIRRYQSPIESLVLPSDEVIWDWYEFDVLFANHF